MRRPARPDPLLLLAWALTAASGVALLGFFALALLAIWSPGTHQDQLAATAGLTAVGAVLLWLAAAAAWEEIS